MSLKEIDSKLLVSLRREPQVPSLLAKTADTTERYASRVLLDFVKKGYVIRKRMPATGGRGQPPWGYCLDPKLTRRGRPPTDGDTIVQRALGLKGDAKSEDTVPKKRGRPRKEQVAVATVTPPKDPFAALRMHVRAVLAELDATLGDTAPKKRGRPPKATSTVEVAPKRRGRPPKAVAEVAPPKRRGRPKKAQAEEPTLVKRPRGRPRKAVAVAASNGVAEKAPRKRRGRPSKSAAAVSVAEPLATTVEETSVAAEVSAPPTNIDALIADVDDAAEDSAA